MISPAAGADRQAPLPVRASRLWPREITEPLKLQWFSQLPESIVLPMASVPVPSNRSEKLFEMVERSIVIVGCPKATTTGPELPLTVLSRISRLDSTFV